MYLKKELKKMQNKESHKAEIRKHYILHADWLGLAKDAVENLKKVKNVVEIYLKLDHINGLEIEVFCENFGSTVREIAHIEASGLFGRYDNTWGSIHSHDISDMSISYLTNFYKIKVR